LAPDDSWREREMRTGRRLVVALAFALLGFGIAVPAAGADNTALRVEIPGAPMRVHGSDGREHIDYDLVITNEFTSEVTLTSVTVRGGGRRLLRLAGAELANFTHQTLVRSRRRPSLPRPPSPR
jgi:hypothetical protein